LAISMSASELESHPSLELLITTTEETWMFWALGLDPSNLKGRVLLNLDTEWEEEICISSAWGCRLNIKWDYIWKKSSLNFYKITFWWMKWWHSWIDINKNRWNALFDIVYFLKNYNWEYQLAELNWWVADNAIPYLVDVIVWVSDIQDFVDELWIFVEDTKNIYDAPDLYCNIKKYNFDWLIVDNKIIDSLFDVILDNKVGIFSMSENTTWLVKTSSNLWLMSIKENKIDISYLFRSSEKREQDNIWEIIISNFKWIWFKTEIESIYYWWEENKDNEFIKKVKKAYDETNHKDNKLISYHAGLECWIIIDKLNNDVQAVSIWPNIYDAHSSKERCEVRSIWVICDVVKRILS
jgi:dipeptidase D